MGRVRWFRRAFLAGAPIWVIVLVLAWSLPTFVGFATWTAMICVTGLVIDA